MSLNDNLDVQNIILGDFTSWGPGFNNVTINDATVVSKQADAVPSAKQATPSTEHADKHKVTEDGGASLPARAASDEQGYDTDVASPSACASTRNSASDCDQSLGSPPRKAAAVQSARHFEAAKPLEEVEILEEVEAVKLLEGKEEKAKRLDQKKEAKRLDQEKAAKEKEEAAEREDESDASPSDPKKNKKRKSAAAGAVYTVFSNPDTIDGLSATIAVSFSTIQF